MAIALPDFENTFCQMVGVCSHLKEEAAMTLPPEDIEIISRYKAHSGKIALARLVWNPATRHLHVDAALPAAFGKTPPTADTPIATFRKVLARFEGLTVRARPHGSFDIPLNNLPAAGGLIFVGNSAIKLSTGKTDIELTGATLTFRRSAIRRISWNLLKDTVWLDISATRLELVLVANSFTDVLGRFDVAVSTYILGKKAHALGGA